MSDPVTQLVEAIDRKDAQGIREVYAPAARLVAMTPNTFQVAVGADDVAAKLAEFLASWRRSRRTRSWAPCATATAPRSSSSA